MTSQMNHQMYPDSQNEALLSFPTNISQYKLLMLCYWCDFLPLFTFMYISESSSYQTVGWIYILASVCLKAIRMLVYHDAHTRELANFALCSLMLLPIKPSRQNRQNCNCNCTKTCNNCFWRRTSWGNQLCYLKRIWHVALSSIKRC